ncbi:hypothetical protein BDP55DRAFT_425995 [Colletotrichum godetiae]|uniref:Uncharacterized protein n=1 Tax=Colletotrichum godetiae TaxID=1209918 RepID=A0AAJ0AST1_9PEZI|nr:uncharacterized protein BDP55DRAFT_425995 [Colletotrichum godetiae]KAK1688982.1 hypothetical protein BDP55DRAFT_425995 [Colletotrichum godetiae]
MVIEFVHTLCRGTCLWWVLCTPSNLLRAAIPAASSPSLHLPPSHPIRDDSNLMEARSSPVPRLQADSAVHMHLQGARHITLTCKRGNERGVDLRKTQARCRESLWCPSIAPTAGLAYKKEVGVRDNG